MEETNAGLIHSKIFGAAVMTFFKAVPAVREMVENVRAGGVYVDTRFFSFLAGPMKGRRKTKSAQGYSHWMGHGSQRR